MKSPGVPGALMLLGFKLSQTPQTASASLEVAPVIPTPNLRSTCTPRCANTWDEGQYRCDKDENGNEICNTYELKGEHNCHFHYYARPEIAQCMRDAGQQNVIVLGESTGVAVMYSALRWMDEDIDNKNTFNEWMLGEENTGYGSPTTTCGQVSLAPDGALTKTGGIRDQGECSSVFSRAETTGDANFMYSSAESLGDVSVLLDDLVTANRHTESGYILVYVGPWYLHCLNGEQWACDAVVDGEEVAALQGAGIDTHVEWFDEKYRRLAERIQSEFPGYTPMYVGLNHDCSHQTAFDEVVQQVNVDFNGVYVNLNGITGHTGVNKPDNIYGYPPHIINLSVFQRVMSVVCEADLATDTECEEQMVGSAGCQTEYEHQQDDNWWSPLNRACLTVSFVSTNEAPAPEAAPAVKAPMPLKMAYPTVARMLAPGDPNLLVNGDFSGGLTSWISYVNPAASAVVTVTDGEVEYAVTGGGTEGWHLQLFQEVAVTEGSTYTLSMDLLSGDEGPREVFLFIQQINSPWTFFGGQVCAVVTGATTPCTVTGVILSGDSPVKFGVQSGLSDVDFAVANAYLAVEDGGVPTPAPVATGGNLLVNGGFAQGLTGWVPYVNDVASAVVTVTAGEAEFAVADGGTAGWHLQLFQEVAVTVGSTYTLSMDLLSGDEGFREVFLYIQQINAPWTFFGGQVCAVVTGATTPCTVTGVILSGDSPVKFGVQAGLSDVDFAVTNAFLVEGEVLPTPAPTVPTPPPTVPPTPVPSGTPPPVPPPGSGNLLVNGDFAQGLAGWEPYIEEGEATAVVAVTDGEAEFTIEDGGTEDWHLQLYQVVPVTAGTTYTVSVHMVPRAPGFRSAFLYIQQAGDPWAIFARQECVAHDSGAAPCTLTGTVLSADVPVKVGVDAGGRRKDIAMDDFVLVRAEVNLFTNPAFAGGGEGWITYVDPSADALVLFTAGEAEFQFTTAGPEDWTVQMYQEFAIEVGATYRLSFDLLTLFADRTVSVIVQQTAGTFDVFAETDCALSTTVVTTCSLTVTLDDATQLVRFGVHAGLVAEDFVVDNAELVLL